MAVLILGNGVAPVKGAREFDPIGGYNTSVYWESNTLWIDGTLGVDDIVEFTPGAGTTFHSDVHYDNVDLYMNGGVIYTDTISEYTNAAGVTFDSTLFFTGLSEDNSATYVVSIDPNDGSITYTALSDLLAYGTEDQIPVTNAAGTGFDYSAGFTFNSTTNTLLLGEAAVSSTVIQAAQGTVANPTGVDLHLFGGEPYNAAGADAGDIVIKAGNARSGDAASTGGITYISPGVPYNAGSLVPVRIGATSFTNSSILLEGYSSNSNTDFYIRTRGTGNIYIGSGSGTTVGVYFQSTGIYGQSNLFELGTATAAEAIIQAAPGNVSQNQIDLTLKGSIPYTVGDIDSGGINISTLTPNAAGKSGDITISTANATATASSDAGDIILKGGNANNASSASSAGHIYLVPGNAWQAATHSHIYLGHSTLAGFSYLTVEVASSIANVPLYLYPKGTGDLTLGTTNTAGINAYGTTEINLFAPLIKVGRTGTDNAAFQGITSTVSHPNGYGLYLRGSDAWGTGGGNGGDIFIYGGAGDGAGTRGNVYIGDGTANAYLPARVAETNVVYYNTTTGKLSYDTPGSATTDNMLVKEGHVQVTSEVTTTIVTLPSDVIVWEVWVNVITQFNDSGTDLLYIGVTGNNDLFSGAGGFDLAAGTGWTEITGETPYWSVGGEDVTFNYDGQNNDGTLGEAYVYVKYSIPS